MEVKGLQTNQILIKLTIDELVILNNALNEVCNALDITEFSTRMGAELEEARNLLRQIGETIDATGRITKE
jgi:hypothetical protein